MRLSAATAAKRLRTAARVELLEPVVTVSAAANLAAQAANDSNA